ncbi:MAG: hypothetical protein M0D57_06870 [Sphingobacteriales bacterium JAD_PAG50586_3]|nr:MAG: hypothetical protein M0D57_06870 [Sphingobacteriales bacterium JAD_PAG50586_3]
MKNVVVSATMVAIVLFACKKDNTQNIDSTPIPEPKVSMMPLKEGNYWVYQRFTVDTNGVATTNGQTDSLYISGKEVIHGDTFYVVDGSNYFLFTPYQQQSQKAYLRDSLGYLVDETGNIYYSENNYTDTLWSQIDTSYVSRYTFMAYKDSSVTVPVGTFNQTGTLLTTAIFHNPAYPWGPRRDSYYTYAKNVGLIKRRLFYSTPPDYIEFRLLRYSVSP